MAPRVLSLQCATSAATTRAEASLGGWPDASSTGPTARARRNLLEALYFGCTGRSFRTRNERELVRFGADATRVIDPALDEDEPHELAVGFGAPRRGPAGKRMTRRRRAASSACSTSRTGRW